MPITIEMSTKPVPIPIANSFRRNPWPNPASSIGIEQGRPGATIGAYTAVLHVLGLDADLDAVAATDPIGRDLQDANLKRRQRVKT